MTESRCFIFRIEFFNIIKTVTSSKKFLAGLHAVAQGTLSLVQGGNFGQAFVSGALGSFGASAFGVAAKEAANTALGTIAFGSLAGGFGSALTGGNFWQGALIGGVVAGLNHVMHQMDIDPLRKQLRDEFEGTGMKPGDNASYEDYATLTEKLPTLKNLKTKTGSTFSKNDNLGSGVDGKQVGQTNKIQINSKLIKTKLDYAYTLGHEMFHVFDSIYNYSTIMSIVGKTQYGARAFDYYKEYRAYMWEYNMGNNINVSSYLKQYSAFPEAINKVYNNLTKLNASMINP